jgi:hypothetical protein
MLKLIRNYINPIGFAEHGTISASLCNLAGRYDNPIPTWFPVPIDCLNIPAQHRTVLNELQR